jgi:NAD(P)-dependent dehydrogenase (short-subunit alcohol dehydrogenase family)
MTGIGEAEAPQMAGRRVLVTGGASGIGKATAKLLLRRGAKVVIVDADQARLAGVASELGVPSIVIDLADAAGIRPMVEHAAALMGGLDGVVNCAGISLAGKPFAAIEQADWARVLAVNLTAPFLICQAALPYLTAHPRASIVNVSSATGLSPTKGSDPAYISSKAGLLGLTKAMAADFGPGIRVNAVCPGLVDTPMVAGRIADVDASGAPKAAALYALKRAADPRELAESICFLLGDGAGYITGATLAVDGGRTFH